MKKVFFVGGLISLGFSIAAQTKTVSAKKTIAKPLPPASLLKTSNDSASYAIGLSVAAFYKHEGITKLNTACLSKAVNDIFAGKPALFDDAAASAVMNSYMTKMQEEKAAPTIVEGEKFLAQNKLSSTVKTTASGLQYEVITQGTGEKPLVTDSVTCNYKGTYISGLEFDNSYKRGQPVTFALNHVIRGWTEGLQLMSVGSKYKFWVPYTLGYGAFDYNGIPGGSMLIFEVELLNVKKP